MVAANLETLRGSCIYISHVLSGAGRLVFSHECVSQHSGDCTMLTKKAETLSAGALSGRHASNESQHCTKAVAQFMPRQISVTISSGMTGGTI